MRNFNAYPYPPVCFSLLTCTCAVLRAPVWAGFVVPTKTVKRPFPPSLHLSSLHSYLLLLLLFILLGEEGVNPPDLGEHAAVRQAEAEAEEPEAELGETGKSEMRGC